MILKRIINAQENIIETEEMYLGAYFQKWWKSV